MNVPMCVYVREHVCTCACTRVCWYVMGIKGLIRSHTSWNLKSPRLTALLMGSVLLTASISWTYLPGQISHPFPLLVISRSPI